MDPATGAAAKSVPTDGFRWPPLVPSVVRVENSFIPVEGVGERTERTLWEAGVTHWDAFDGDAVGPTRAERIRAFIDRGRTALADGDADFFDRAFPSAAQWRLYETFRDGTCFFDIETTGLDAHSSVVTTVSVHQAGDTRTLVRGDDLTAETLQTVVDDADLLVSYNGKRFDVPFLEQCLDVTIDRPHLDLMYPCRRLGLDGGLDGVEAALGIERDRPDISGRDAVRLWREHEAGRDGALDTLVSYNREDTVNLQTVLETVCTRLEPAAFAEG
jgi:uncharacterized protein YprB with RNaseH-like and TPR domain